MYNCPATNYWHHNPSGKCDSPSRRNHQQHGQWHKGSVLKLLETQDARADAWASDPRRPAAVPYSYALSASDAYAVFFRVAIG